MDVFSIQYFLVILPEINRSEMGKDKIRRFNENKTFENVVQPTREEAVNNFPLKGNWNKDFFKNDNPIVLELGCGKGEYTVAMARREDVAKEAKSRGTTRASVAMEKAAALESETGPQIYAIGNAPTALIELERLMSEDKVHPALIIGVPVGFVNVVAAKELIIESGVDCIVARGRKGGSNVAAAIVNALMYQAVNRDEL